MGLLSQLSAVRSNRYGVPVGGPLAALERTADAVAPFVRPAAAMAPYGGLLSGYTAEDAARLRQPDQTAFTVSNPLATPGVDQGWDVTEHDLARVGLLGDMLDFAPLAGGLLGSAAWMGKQMARRGGGARRATFGQGGMIGYHGSPHRINNVSDEFPLGQFDSSKIGTGEGAQAYGHGLYFAENPDVAKGYIRTIGPQGKWQIDGNIFDAEASGGAESIAAERLSWFDGDVDDAITDLRDGGLAEDLRAADLLENATDIKEAGHLYKVDIPDESIDRMLDWDAPLSEQPEAVREALRSAGIGPNEQAIARANENVNAAWDNYQSARKQYGYQDARTPDAEALWQNARDELDGLQQIGRMTGGDLIRGSSSPLKGMSDANGIVLRPEDTLRKAGIPGIKYYDGGSRAAGEGTRNFVVFDDKLPKILERDGQTLEGLLGAGLPMDEASRMQRARDMGFGGDLYHASKQDIDEFIPGYEDGLTFVTDNPEMANDWLGKGKYRSRIGAEDEIAAVEDAYLRTKQGMFDYEELNKLEGVEFTEAYDAAQKRFNDLHMLRPEDSYSAIYPVRSNVKKTFDPRKDYKLIEDFLKKQPGMAEAIRQGSHKQGNWLIYENKATVDELKRMGYDSMAITEGVNGAHETIAIFDPKNIRSKFAKFDPAKKDSANILASAAGAGLLGAGGMQYGGGLLYQPDTDI